MRVLFATPYLPCPPDFGGARRMYELIRGVGRSADVEILSLTDDSSDLNAAQRDLARVTAVPVPFTARYGTTRERRMLQLRSVVSTASAQSRLYSHSEYQSALDRILAATRFDLVQFEFSQMGGYPVRSGLPTVLDVHNVEHDLMRRMASRGSMARRLFNSIEFRKVRREEYAAWRNATCCVATSSGDAAVVSTHTGRDVPVIPNGVDLEYFALTPLAKARPGAIAFVGAMRYRPNADGARFFTERVLPLIRRSAPDAIFNVVGADPMPEVAALAMIPGVTVTGTVPDVRPWLESSEIAVVPVFSGGGTRIKILEAFAAGRPVVSTTIGAEGLEVIDREHLLLADDSNSFAAAVLQLMVEPSLRQSLITNARSLVRERYQWSSIADRLCELHDNLVGTSGHGA